MITFADGISLAENDLAGRCYAMLDKAQIPYNLKSDIHEPEPGTVRCSSGDPECIRVCDGAVT